jgi:hypothetical protein
MIKLIASAGLTMATVFASGSVSPRWKADLDSQNGSKVEGSATVEARGADSTAVTISLHGGELNKSYAWHLHDGGCATTGAIVGMETAYPELQTSGTGTVETSVTLGFAAPSSGTHSVHVHPMAPTLKSGEPVKKFLETSVACGELKPAGDTPQEGR